LRTSLSILSFVLWLQCSFGQSLYEPPKDATWIEQNVNPDIAHIPTTPTDSIQGLDPARFVWRVPTLVRSGHLYSDSNSKRHHLVIEKDGAPSIPVLSLFTDEANLFDEENGILVPGATWTQKRSIFSGNYQQRGSKWERPVSISYYEKGRLVFQSNCGLRTHGLLARSSPQKSLRLCERLDMNSIGLDYPFFGHEQPLPYLLLRSPYSSHTGNVIADMVVQSLVGHTSLAPIEFQPLACYINGVYWGLMHLRPRPDESFYADFHQVSLNRISMDDKFQDSTLIALRTYIAKHPSESEYFLDSVAQYLDLENFMDYMIIETYFRNLDWAGNNNVQFYRVDHGPLKLALIDLDATFQVEDQNMFVHIEKQGKVVSELWSALRANVQFKHDYIQRYTDLQAICLNTEAVTHKIDSISLLVSTEIENQVMRWGYPTDFITWQESVRDMREFALNRPHFAALHLRKELNTDSVLIPEKKSNIWILIKFAFEQYKLWVVGFFLLLIAIGALLVFKRS
jgi:hypothetical protein